MRRPPGIRVSLFWRERIRGRWEGGVRQLAIGIREEIRREGVT